jgi:hypothetical protein
MWLDVSPGSALEEYRTRGPCSSIVPVYPAAQSPPLTTSPRLSPLKDKYHQAEDQIGTLESGLAAQTADQAALNAMTGACEAAPAG